MALTSKTEEFVIEVIRKVASDAYTMTTVVILAREALKKIEEETPEPGPRGDLNDE